MDKTIQKNGLIKKDLLILSPFIEKPWDEFTLTEIKKITKKKSHHYVFEALKKFTKLKLLNETKKGNTNIYNINLENKNLHYLAFVESIRKENMIDIPYQIIEQITKNIKSPFYTLLIGGSYAQGKQKSKSDLDIVFIIPNCEDKKLYKVALKEGELTIPEIHGYIFTMGEFCNMLINNEFNYGKELARKHIIYYGAEVYFKILFEGIKNGFKG